MGFFLLVGRIVGCCLLIMIFFPGFLLLFGMLLPFGL